LLAVLAMAAGCQSYDQRLFDVAVKNNSANPITVGLAKNGPPFEPVWASPEDVAIDDPRNTGLGWGKVVPPGQVGYIERVPGRFSRNTSAFLRIYQGDLALADLLSVSKGSPNRHDVRLRPGRSVFVVSDRAEFIDVFESPVAPTTQP
jgi:hypothetical protein